MEIKDCKILELPKISDSRGHLIFIESTQHIPFEIKRIYYLYDVANGASRGGHAHKKLHQLFVPISGSFTVSLDDGQHKRFFHLNDPAKGLYVCPMMWRDLVDFSKGAVCLVLASNAYTEDDYLRNYEDFIAATNMRTDA